jgi:hypothetical protein
MDGVGKMSIFLFRHLNNHDGRFQLIKALIAGAAHHNGALAGLAGGKLDLAHKQAIGIGPPRQQA